MLTRLLVQKESENRVQVEEQQSRSLLVIKQLTSIGSISMDTRHQETGSKYMFRFFTLHFKNNFYVHFLQMRVS